MVDADVYTYSDSHEFFSDLNGAIVEQNGEILNKTQVDGTFDGDDVIFPAVTGGTTEAIVIYRRTAGAANTWSLVAYIEEADVVNLPLQPNGGEVQVLWSASGIFTL